MQMRAVMRSLKPPRDLHTAHHTDNAIRTTLYPSLLLHMPSIMAAMASKEDTSEALPPYQYSVPLPPQAYEGIDYFCLFRPRIHRNSSYADDASWQCQIDFLDATGAARPNAQRNTSHASYAVGNINPRVGNFAALGGCEVLPERLALVSYICEYLFIHDDGQSLPSIRLLVLLRKC